MIALILFSSMVSAQQDQDDSKTTKDIPRGTLRALDEFVIPAMRSGNVEVFMNTITPIIERSQRGQLDAVEDYCESKGVGSVKSQFADLVLLQIEQGQVDLNSKHDLTLAIYLADELARKVEAGINQLNTHDVMLDPMTVPDDWQLSEQLFWEVHVFKNEFSNAQRLVDFGVAVLKPHFRRVNKSGDAEMLAVFEKVDKLSKTLPKTFREMIEREAEMRLIRFNRSVKQLHANGDFEKLLIAAMSVELDSESLSELFRENDPESFTRPALQDPQLPKTIQQTVKNAREVGDDVSLKAILLRSGLHYWLRGRYGEGQLANGLLKSPEAMNSRLAMEGLYMPKQRPKPISDYHDNESSEPGYDRRHYYTWAVEHRPLMKEAGYGRDYDSVSRTTSARATGKFW